MPPGKSRRHWTVQGHVVYDRPVHYWTTKDLKRLIDRMDFEPEELNPDSLIDLIREVTKLMLQKILALVGLDEATDAVYEILYTTVDQILKSAEDRGVVITPEAKAKLSSFIAGH